MSQLSSETSSASIIDENSGCESEEDYKNAKFNSINDDAIRIESNQPAVQNSGKMFNRYDDRSTASQANASGSVNNAGQTASSTPSISTTIPSSSFNETRMRRKLIFFFMNPIEKWQTKRRFPYKFVVQLLKLAMVSMQLCLFAHSRYNHVNYTWDNRISFSHLFLKGWDATLEVESYPPAIGPLALYVQDDFYDTIDYAVNGYQNLTRAIGPYSYPNEDNTMAPIELCLFQYKQGIIFGFNESYIFNSEIEKMCMDLTGNITDIGIRQYLMDKNVVMNFSSLVQATLGFAVKTVNFKVAGPFSPPDCYKFDIEILFDNADHDGQMLLSLDAEALRLHCQGDVEYITNYELDAALRSILNSLVIIICIVSFALCARAIYRAQLLRMQTQQFFRQNFERELSMDGKIDFINFWYIMIIFNDILLILGSAMKEQIERTNFTADEWNICSVLLGIGNLLVWFGVLRYLGFFKTYNVVILTLKRAAPKISRFLLCALLIYAGFTFCGWLVLGPYHIKFRSLATTSECLFALINGDDMFATFSTMSAKSDMLWWFSRVYLYSFVSLYIYVVLSLFISVIMDAYDTIKKYYIDGFPINDLKMFMGPAINVQEFSSAVYDDDDESDSLADIIKNFFCSCPAAARRRRGADTDGPTGYTSLVSTPKV